MQLQDKYRIALLTTYALALHGFESLLPTPIPWLRLGIANIIILVALVLYGLRVAIMVTLLRVVISSFFVGTFLGPSFMLSLSGGVTSTLAMGVILSITPRLFSTVGLSLIGALVHNVTQLLIAYILFVQRIGAILVISPFLILLGVATGVLNGVVAEILIQNLKKNIKKVQNS